jgi:hypothetical protein
MEYRNYPARILVDLFDALKIEASNEGRSINRQLEMILKERYHAHAPPVSQVHTRPVSKSNNGNRNPRKSKATV